MPFIVLPVFFLFFIKAYTQVSEQTTWENGKVKDVYEPKGKNIVLFKHYSPQGILISEGRYVNNRREGIWKQYYPSGKIRAILNYKKGWEHGNQKIYAETGELISEFTYRYGRKQGNYTLYYNNGMIKEKGNYDISSFRSYVPHPPPAGNSNDTELPGQASMRVGKNIEYFESGKIKCIRYFENQYDIILTYDKSNENNQITIQLQKQEVPTNRWLYFDETGKIIRQEIYEQGKLKEAMDF
jgi:antitoxin component YwqK of YwqJK toxin-antitoxin module